MCATQGEQPPSLGTGARADAGLVRHVSGKTHILNAIKPGSRDSQTLHQPLLGGRSPCFNASVLPRTKPRALGTDCSGEAGLPPQLDAAGLRPPCCRPLPAPPTSTIKQ